MSKFKYCLLALIFAAASTAVLAQDPVEEVFEGCGAEIEKYCSQVTLGEGRLAACFFAHEDKLSSRCQHTLYDVALQLEQAINAIAYIAEVCGSDIDEFCADTEVGDGRILNCLTAEREKISEECATALADAEE